MTNEQIIIDGADVSGCPEYREDTGFCKAAFRPELEPFCQEFNCYYKQMQRLKAENEAMRCELDELKEKHHNVLNLAKQNADSSEYCMRELEEQTEELKQQNESLRNHISDLLQQLNALKEARDAGS